MKNEKITEAIKRLDDLGTELFEKFGTDSYPQRCELHDIKELLKQVNGVDLKSKTALHKHVVINPVCPNCGSDDVLRWPAHKLSRCRKCKTEWRANGL